MKLPSSIRGKVSLAATLVTAAAMVLIVATAAFATQVIMKDAVSVTLANQLDDVQRQLEGGTVPSVIAGSGSDLIQIIDENGQVVASSAWAQGMPALSKGVAPGETYEKEVADLSAGLAFIANPGGQSGSGGVGGDSDYGDLDYGDLDYGDPDYGDSDYGDVDDGDSGYDDADSADDGDSGYASVVDNADAGDSSYGATDYGDPASDYDSGSGSSDYGSSDYGDSEYALSSYGRVGGARQENLLVAAKGFLRELARPPMAFAAEPSAPGSPADGSAASGHEFDLMAGATEASLDFANSELMGLAGPFLVIERGVPTPMGNMTIVSLTSLAPAVAAAKSVTGVFALIMLVSLVLVALLSWKMTERTLRPVETMRSTVAGISASDFSERIPVPEGDPELSKLAVTFNHLLARVEASMNEQRRFVSDASHELKSPVAAIRVMLETVRDHGDVVDIDLLTKDLMAENDRVGGIVGNLLLLAQHDEGSPRLDKHPIDLCDLLYEEALSLKSRSSVQLDLSGIEPVVCVADGMALRHAVRNLLDNAARYARSAVKVSCTAQEGVVVIAVSDDGPGIPAADRERVFGRFVRLEEGRSRKEGSTGLGLSVVKTIAEQHGGTARFVDGELGGATAELAIAASC